MKKFFNWILVLGACVGAFYGIGLIVPRNQTKGSRTDFQAKPEAIYLVVADHTTWAAWFPGVAAVRELTEKNDHPRWGLTDDDGHTFELEVLGGEEPRTWSASYEQDGTRFNLRFDLTWYGEGSRVRVTRTADTRDAWLRAKHFLWSDPGASPVAVLTALAEQLGEGATEIEDR